MKECQNCRRQLTSYDAIVAEIAGDLTQNGTIVCPFCGHDTGCTIEEVTPKRGDVL